MQQKTKNDQNQRSNAKKIVLFSFQVPYQDGLT